MAWLRLVRAGEVELSGFSSVAVKDFDFSHREAPALPAWDFTTKTLHAKLDYTAKGSQPMHWCNSPASYCAMHRLAMSMAPWYDLTWSVSQYLTYLFVSAIRNSLPVPWFAGCFDELSLGLMRPPWTPEAILTSQSTGVPYHNIATEVQQWSSLQLLGDLPSALLLLPQFLPHSRTNWPSTPHDQFMADDGRAVNYRHLFLLVYLPRWDWYPQLKASSHGHDRAWYDRLAAQIHSLDVDTTFCEEKGRKSLGSVAGVFGLHPFWYAQKHTSTDFYGLYLHTLPERSCSSLHPPPSIRRYPPLEMEAHLEKFESPSWSGLGPGTTVG